MRNCLVIVSILILFLSCNDRDRVVSFTLDQAILDTADILKPESVDFNIPITAGAISVWHDSIAIVLNVEDGNRKMLELYNMNDGTLIKDFFFKGRGPNEILSSIALLHNDTIVVDEFVQHKIAVLPVRSLLFDNDYKPVFRPYDMNSQRMWPYRGKLLGVNPNCYVDKRNGINNDGERFIVSDSCYKYVETRHFEVNTINLTGADFFISYGKNRIFYYSIDRPEIEIYDTNLRLLKKIHGIRHNDNIKYTELNGYLYSEREYDDAYTNACTDSEYVYIVYLNPQPGDTSWEDSDNYVLKFDWDGNFIDSYLIRHGIAAISVSEDGRSLYAFGTGQDGYPVLNKYLMR